MTSSSTEAFTLADIGHSAHVTRWHSKNCHRYPSIAEHSFIVTMMASRLYNLIESFPEPEIELALLKLAMWHDMPEVITGDLPTPIKRWLETYFKDGINPLEELEESICLEYREANDCVNEKGEFLYLIFKIADVAEAYRFIQAEGKGNQRDGIACERMRTLTKMRGRLETLMYERIRGKISPSSDLKGFNQAMDKLSDGLDVFFSELDLDEVKELDFVEKIRQLPSPGK